MLRPRAVALQSKRIGERGWRRGRTPVPLVNLSEWLKLRHALTPSRRRGPAPTALRGVLPFKTVGMAMPQPPFAILKVERRA